MRQITLTLPRTLEFNSIRRVQVSWDKSNKESHQVYNNNPIPCGKLSIILLREHTLT